MSLITIEQHEVYSSQLVGKYKGGAQHLCAYNRAGRVLKRFLKLTKRSKDVVTIRIREVCRWDYGEPGDCEVPEREGALYLFVCSEARTIICENIRVFTKVPSEKSDCPFLCHYDIRPAALLLRGPVQDAVRKATGRLSYAGKQLALLEITEVRREKKKERRS